MRPPRLVFDTPLTRDESPEIVVGRIGPAVYSQQSRLEAVKAKIRMMAREAFIRRREVGHWHHDHLRYVYRRLREAWAEALNDAAPGVKSDGGLTRFSLDMAMQKLWEVRLLVMAAGEREEVKDEQRASAAKARAALKQKRNVEAENERILAEYRRIRPTLPDERATFKWLESWGRRVDIKLSADRLERLRRTAGLTGKRGRPRKP